VELAQHLAVVLGSEQAKVVGAGPACSGDNAPGGDGGGLREGARGVAEGVAQLSGRTAITTDGVAGEGAGMAQQ
jgi:hypothetical protein